MAETKIQWAHYTMNPWRGCTKVSPGCDNCYAETMSKRNPSVLGSWGPNGMRVVASESYWKLPLKWNREAADAGERRRVFCASLADVFEGPETMPASCVDSIKAARRRLFKLITATPNLDWLLLTKRPQNVLPLTRKAIDPFDDPETDFNAAGEPNGLEVATFAELFPNVWLGTSVENQDQTPRIDELLKIQAAVRFLSMEPLLGAVELRHRFQDGGVRDYLTGQFLGMKCTGVDGNPDFVANTVEPNKLPRIQWVIAGGESGPGARSMDVAWARSLRDQCKAAAVPFFMKQVGAEPYIDHSPEPAASLARKHGVGPLVAEFLVINDRKGGDMEEFPDDLRVREFPSKGSDQ